jgi:hypothetical protein
MHTDILKTNTPQISQLENEAPGIFGIFGRLFDDMTVSHLSKAYEVTVAHGGAIEHPVLREEDASFNPRPTRIAQIIWTETRCTDPLAYALALLSCCHPEEQASLSALFPDEIRQCFPIWQQMVMPATDAPLLVHDIALAQLLDKARHLHMTDLPDMNQREFHHFVVNEILPCARPASENAIVRKLQHWANLWIRQRSQNSSTN